MEFAPTAQRAENVYLTIKCKKPQLLYTLKKLKYEKGIVAFKQFISAFNYVCGSSFREIQDDSHPDIKIAEKVFVRENLSCEENCTTHVKIMLPSVSNMESRIICYHKMLSFSESRKKM